MELYRYFRCLFYRNPSCGDAFFEPVPIFAAHSGQSASRDRGGPGFARRDPIPVGSPGAADIRRMKGTVEFLVNMDADLLPV